MSLSSYFTMIARIYYSFLTDPRNKEALEKTNPSLADVIVANPELLKKYIRKTDYRRSKKDKEQKIKQIHWNRAAMKKWLKLEQVFLRFFLVLFRAQKR